MERVTPDSVFEKTGLDYAGPLNIKYGHIHKLIMVKSYVCVFVSLNVKAVHLELVSDLTTAACLRCFVARRCCGATMAQILLVPLESYENLLSSLSYKRPMQGEVSDLCSAQAIQWKFIPECSPNFGGLWEAAVKGFKTHFWRVVGHTKLMFEETTTVITQIEACMSVGTIIIQR